MPNPRKFPNWDDVYRTNAIEQLPWYWPTLDPDLEAALARHGIVAGRALDQGTGPGTQAIELAKRGFVVTATDVSAAALEYAQHKARDAAVDVTFMRDDILQTQLTGTFDVIVDRGCFHVFAPEHRREYIDAMHRLLSRGGWLFGKAFSHLQPGETGPYQFTPANIHEIFSSDQLEVVDVIETVYHGQFEPKPFALFFSVRRRT